MNEAKKTYGEKLYERYKDQIVELYIGDDNGVRSYSDFDVYQKSFIRGKLIGADGDLIELEVIIETPERNYKDILCIHSWCIKGAMKYSNKGYSILNLFGNSEGHARKKR